MIIDQGRAVADGSPAELKHQGGGNVIEVHVRNRDDLAPVAAVLARLAPAGDSPPVIDEPTRSISDRSA